MRCEGNARPVRTICDDLLTYRSSLPQGHCRWEFSARQNRPVQMEQWPTEPVVPVEVGSVPDKSCGGLVEVGDCAGSIGRIDRHRKGFEQLVVM